MSVIERFQQIVPIANPSGHEAALRSHIIDALRAMQISDYDVDAAGNLLVRTPGDQSKETILLSAHMDSVPPCEGIVPVSDTRQERPMIRSEGRTILGADDKSGVAVILDVVESLAKEGFQSNHPLELFFSTGEEVGLTGAKAFDMSRLRAKYCYVLDGEGRVGLIFNAGPSQENVQIHCHGRASHAGISPESGVSAIQMAGMLCSQLPSGRLADDLTANIGKIEGGVALNVVAPSCTISGEMRSHSEEKLSGLIAQYQSICEQVEAQFQGGKIEFTHVRRYNRFEVQPEQVSIQRAWDKAQQLNLHPQLASMNIGSDAHILNERGIPTVVLGMGFHYSHSLGEFIFCEELEQVAQLVRHLIA